MATLTQYWNAEVTRLATALSAEQVALASLRNSLAAAQAVQRAAADAVRSQGNAVTAARKALAGIPMPADGDPLLLQMEQALAELAAARVGLANAELEVQGLRADLGRQQQRAEVLTEELGVARTVLLQATQDAAARAAMADALTTGDLAGLAADAAAALAADAANARARVESEFPSSATAAKDFLKRVRARRAIVEASASAAVSVESAAFNASHDALAQAQRAYAAAQQGVVALHQAAPALAADSATLSRLAALPVAVPPTSFPILTQWQRAHLHDASKKSARETALAKLKDVDDAGAAVRVAQASYDQALYAALKAEPDATQAQLDATTISAERTTLDGKLADLMTARAALDGGARATLQAWFAAVPDTLWEALEGLDRALARLTLLQGPPTAAALLSALNAAETSLASALSAARLAQREANGADAAYRRASAARLAENETQGQRALAFARSSAAF
ncbi:hypothetical protein [Accumulibacter sp.]|uniref:hypothetical protein n=1 Tax=Accumulibacter sp. TaxID=2053492 RepID=UPI0028C3BC89|nr:hypothetical protein [Accumulibacter sp.]